MYAYVPNLKVTLPVGTVSCFGREGRGLEDWVQAREMQTAAFVLCRCLLYHTTMRAHAGVCVCVWASLPGPTKT